MTHNEATALMRKHVEDALLKTFPMYQKLEQVTGIYRHYITGELVVITSVYIPDGLVVQMGNYIVDTHHFQYFGIGGEVYSDRTDGRMYSQEFWWVKDVTHFSDSLEGFLDFDCLSEIVPEEF